MASAQVNAWLAVHTGLLDEVSHVVDEAPGDAALGRMMLHRRRAVAARVVDEFHAHLGRRFVVCREGQIPPAPGSFTSELEAAKAAGTAAASVDSSALPLLFERALLAEMDGRNADAAADLDKLLESLPGFLSAAITSARLAMIDQDPQRAIGALVYVERELTHLREGSELLADALHMIGMHEAASRYDLAALLCPDHAGSHGNDCAPVDMAGKAANDSRMPAAFVVEALADGRRICNDRGVYYIGRSIAAGSIAELMACQVSSAGSQAGTQEATSHNALSQGGLRHALKRATVPAVAAGRRIFRSIADLGVHRPLYTHYKRLPESLRYRFNQYVLLPLRRLNKGNWRKIPEHHRGSDIARSRLGAGILGILQGPAASPRGTGLEHLGTFNIDGEAFGKFFSDGSSGRDSGGLTVTELTQLLGIEELPPAAAAMLNNLVQRLAESGSDAALRPRNPGQ